jgi:DNA polymerase-3 subunit chi
VQVDFYHLTRDGPERVLPALATRALGIGERMLIVAADPVLRASLSTALWSHTPESFLAHGELDGDNPHIQPLLLADRVEPANGARFIALADGRWRDEALAFVRVFLVFGSDSIAEARQAWIALGAVEGIERHYWKQDGGKWVEQTSHRRQDDDR